ncbi:hypothetical protein [Methylosinus sp. PW1]|uniref:hypothetical protein n=1 Tax=Methylosinus sp. PW1 TaxID=107636 RepID=UPI00068F9917|nr:hypothetical protein [Methylosinus sp. PW1]
MSFSVAEFVKELLRVLHLLPAAERVALEAACKIILEEAKSMPGEYQAGAGPFNTWAPLAQRTLNDKITGGWPVPSPLKRTGELAESYEYKIKGNEAWVGSNNPKATWQELGTSRIPPRPILGIAAARHEKEIVELVGRSVYEALIGRNLHGIVNEGKAAGMQTTMNVPPKPRTWGFKP